MYNIICTILYVQYYMYNIKSMSIVTTDSSKPMRCRYIIRWCCWCWSWVCDYVARPRNFRRQIWLDFQLAHWSHNWWRHAYIKFRLLKLGWTIAEAIGRESNRCHRKWREVSTGVMTNVELSLSFARWLAVTLSSSSSLDDLNDRSLSWPPETERALLVSPDTLAPPSAIDWLDDVAPCSWSMSDSVFIIRGTSSSHSLAVTSVPVPRGFIFSACFLARYCFFLKARSCCFRLNSSSGMVTPLQVDGGFARDGLPGPLCVWSIFLCLERRFWNQTWRT